MKQVGCPDLTITRFTISNRPDSCNCSGVMSKSPIHHHKPPTARQWATASATQYLLLPVQPMPVKKYTDIKFTPPLTIEARYAETNLCPGSELGRAQAGGVADNDYFTST